MTSYPFVSQKYTTSVISLETARKWLRMDIDGYTDEDSVIQDAIDAAISSVEEGCKLSFGESTYTWNLDCLPRGFGGVGFVKEIIKVEGYDGSVYSDIDPANYRLLQISEKQSVIVWRDDYSSTAESFKLTFKAGYEEGNIPPTLLQAIRARIAEWFDNRGDGVSGKRTLSDKLLIPFNRPYAG